MKQNYLSILLILFFLPHLTYSQTTIPFDFGTLPHATEFGATTNIEGFTFTINSSDPSDDIIYDDGALRPNGTGALYDDNLDIGGITQWKITKTDGSEFHLVSIYLQDAGFASENGTITAYKDGAEVTGSTVNIDFNGLQTLSGNPNYENIDEFRIIAIDINFYLDDLTYNIPLPADTTPPVFENSKPAVSSIVQTSLTLETEIDEAGTIYYVIVPNGATAPTSAEVKAGTGNGGSGQITSGNAAVNTGGFTNNFAVTGLTAGTAYDVYVVAQDDEGTPNLQTSPTKVDVTTTKYPLTITANVSQSKIYGATEPTLTYTITGFVNGDNEASLDTPLSIARVVGEDVGNYTITPSAAADVNYSVSFVTAQFAITQAGLTVTANASQSKIYGATEPTLTYTLAGFQGTDNESSLDTPLSIARVVGEDVGNYTITPSAAADVNYSVSFVTAQFAITQAGLTVTANASQSKIYGATEPTLTYTLAGFQGTDNESSLDTPVNIARVVGEDVGNYTITPSAASDVNYNVSFVTAQFAITQAGLTVTANASQSKIYGATEPTLTYTLAGFQGTDNEASLDTPVSIARVVGEDVGNYTITPSAAADVNYNVSFVTAPFAITQAGLTVTANASQSKIYGATEPTLTYTLAGFQGTDNEASLDTPVSIARVVGEDVGNYTITPSAAADVNYNVSFVTAPFAITQAGLTVTANASQSKIYGATEPTLTYTLAGFRGTDNEASLDTPVSIARVVGEDVGNYTITPSAAADVNYNVSFVTAQFAITQAGLTVTANASQSKIYGATEPTLTYTLAGFQGTDNEASLDTPVSIARVVGEDVGNYTITPSAAADVNYNVSFVTAPFAITQAGLTVTANASQSKIYGATEPTLTYTLAGFQGTDNEASLDTPVSIARVVGEDVGNYTITPSAAADVNYNVSFVTAPFAITQAGLTVTANASQSKIYGATEPTLTYTLAGFQGTDNEASLDTPVNIARAVGEDVGNYTITPSAAADVNYSVSFVTAPFAITQAGLTIIGLVGDNKVFDGTTVASASGTPVLSGVLSNDDVVLEGNPVFIFESAELGTDITITTTGFIITGNDNGNYTLTQPTLSADIVATLGVDDITDMKISLKLFPNPSVDYIKISGLSKKANYIIYNLLGKEIAKGKVLNEENIFIQGLSNGTYFIKIKNAKALKFMKM